MRASRAIPLAILVGMGHVTDYLRRNWASYWQGTDVEAMAQDVESRVREAAAAWDLADLAPLSGGEVGVVLAGEDVVLKVSPRGHDEEDQLAAQGRRPGVLGIHRGGATGPGSPGRRLHSAHGAGVPGSRSTMSALRSRTGSGCSAR